MRTPKKQPEPADLLTRTRAAYDAARADGGDWDLWCNRDALRFAVPALLALEAVSKVVYDAESFGDEIDPDDIRAALSLLDKGAS